MILHRYNDCWIKLDLGSEGFFDGLDGHNDSVHPWLVYRGSRPTHIYTHVLSTNSSSREVQTYRRIRRWMDFFSGYASGLRRGLSHGLTRGLELTRGVNYVIR